MMDAAKAAAPNPYCVIFGGPVLLPQDTAKVYQRTEALGYLAALSVLAGWVDRAAIVKA